jgi:hypothetical protein
MVRLVLRRARAARSLLLAAAGVTLIATALLTSLTAYSREVITAGARGAVAQAAPDERSVLVRGSAGRTPADLLARDAAVRAEFAGRLGDRRATVSAAGYATGRQFSGPTGDAVPDAGGIVFASVMFLDALPEHAVLTSGQWPRPGAGTTQTALAESVAGVLGLTTGDRVPITDRRDDKVSTVVVSGVWRPRDARDPYWQLVPDLATGVSPLSATYGPLVVDRADFDARFASNASAAWLAELDLDDADQAGLTRIGTTVTALVTELPERTGLGTSALVSTRFDQLRGRLARADLVGRSALVTPVLLVLILSGLALVLVAALLIEHRRGESALLRARGAARLQLAGLSAREALLVVLPAAAVSPLLTAGAMQLAGRAGTPAVGVPADFWPDPLLWLVAGLAAAGCGAAIVLPALRAGGTYVDDLAAQSRPSRRSVAQRLGVDVVLAALAVLGWFQLQQYASPLAGADAGGGLGIDPFLAAAPTLGVLAGATLALRLLPPIARLAERFVDRRPWTGTLFGMWQAGRRPHAGPVLLLALAVAAGTVAWCLASTSARSVGDQADNEVGADVRAVETGGVAPAGRLAELTALPGADRVLPAWRESLRAGPDSGSAELIALDAATAGPVVKVRDDLFPGGAAGLFEALGHDRVTAPLIDLPAGARRLTGRVDTAGFPGNLQTSAVFSDPAGVDLRVPLRPGEFAVPLPASARPLRLAGFLIGGDGVFDPSARWQVSELAVDGERVRLDGGWQAVGRTAAQQKPQLEAGVLSSPVGLSDTGSVQFAVMRPASDGPVPIVATPEALSRLRLKAGQTAALQISGADVRVRVVATMPAVPGTIDTSALIADLGSLRTVLLHRHGIQRGPQEWWLDADAATAREVSAVPGLRVLDRRELAAASSGDAFGVGARTALFAAALGALLLAAVGITVDVRTTARRRVAELAVLHTLGAGSRLLARSIMVEQAFLAGIGVLVGLVVGIGVAATMAPLLILTPAARRPVPLPLLEIDWPRTIGTAGLLLALALGLSALVGTTLRRRLAAAEMRIGADR